MSVYITGDIHGDIQRINAIKDFCISKKTTTEDVFILLGDVGINYYGDIRDKIRKDIMGSIPVTFLCINGNHEEKPQNIDTYTEKFIFNNAVYYETSYPNILFLKDGETYTINNKNYLVLGGAYSVDKYYRIHRGWKWFKDEQLSEEEQTNILNHISGGKWDYVLSHTCPDTWTPTELFLPSIDQSTVDHSTELWLEKVKNNIKFKKWYFGHFHGEKENTELNYEMLYNKISTIN